jgi:hypothetical protein
MLDLAKNCDGHYDDYPEDLTVEELDVVGTFLQNLTDWIDLGINEPHERISAQNSIADTLSELEHARLRVYAAREKQQMRGGVGPPTAFYALHLRIVRFDDPGQVPVDCK